MTSFRLALDLGDADLFLDLYHCGQAVGDSELAASALGQAQFLTGSSPVSQDRSASVSEEDKYKVFSGSVGGTFNVLEKQLKNLTLSLQGIEKAAPPVQDVADDEEEEEEEGVQVVHFGVV